MDQKQWLKQHGVKDKGRTVYLDGELLEKALCALADNEGPIQQILAAKHAGSQRALTQVCDALRELVDGWENVPEKDDSPLPKGMQGTSRLEDFLQEQGKMEPASEE